MPVEAKELTFTYNAGSPFETAALDHVNFTIKDGEFIGIIGHTGSGKSTLIQPPERSDQAHERHGDRGRTGSFRQGDEP